MTSFRDRLKEIVRTELLKDNTLPDSKYRIGTVNVLNSDGTCLVFLDGGLVTASPLYPVVQGQEVMLIFGDSGSVSAVPTKPNTPAVDIIHPPFFSGGEFVRFVFDETEQVILIAPNFTPVFRVQDEGGGGNVFRFVASDLINYGFPSNNYGLSRDGKKFAFAAVRFGLTGNAFSVRVYDIGGKLSPNPKTMTPITTPTVIPSGYYFTPKVLTNVIGSIDPSIPFSIDTFVDNDGTLYYMIFAATTNLFNPPYPLPINVSEIIVLESYDPFISGTAPAFDNSIGFYLRTDTLSTFTYSFHLNFGGPNPPGPGIITGGTTPWCTVTPQNGTFLYDPGRPPASYDHLLNIVASGLPTLGPGIAPGLYHTTLTTQDVFGNPGKIDVYVAVNTVGSSFRLFKVKSGGSAATQQLLVVGVDITNNYSSGNPQSTSEFILDPSNQLAALQNITTNDIDIVDLSKSVSQIFILSSIPMGGFSQALLGGAFPASFKSRHMYCLPFPNLLIAGSVDTLVRYNTNLKYPPPLNAPAPYDSPGIFDSLSLINRFNLVIAAVMKPDGTGYVLTNDYMTRRIKTINGVVNAATRLDKNNNVIPDTVDDVTPASFIPTPIFQPRIFGTEETSIAGFGIVES